MKVAVLANGEFPTAQIPTTILQEAEHIVCCDGAIEKLLSSSLYRHDMAITVIGDGDSITPALRARCKDFIQIPEQNTNDLAKATRHCIEQGWHDITYLGATGLREDHTLGNVGVLCEYAARYPQASLRMVSDYGTFTPVASTTQFESFHAQQVSLFTLGHNTKATSHGLRWDVDSRHFTNLWPGTLNASMGGSFTIHSQGGITLVYQTHDPK
ncbi:MAG: thiamine diphosphokinase [Bacteroidales bacterium]|nr:thiamine diphosphokinase [Bacteroidales bacterium]